MRRLSTLALLAASLTLTAAQAASPEQTIRAALEQAVPGIKISLIRPAPIAGLYEIMVGTELMYVTEDGRYFVTGHIVDLKTRDDLTEPRLAQLRKQRLEQLDVSQMLTFGPADAKHTVTVFTDIECGYCRKLHSQIADYNQAGIRIRYVFFPRAGKGSPAYDEAVSVWCAGDEEARREALTAAKAGKSIPAKTCDNPIDEHMALGADLGLRGTPAIVTATGEMIPGYVEPKRLAAELNGAKQ
ncbi:disulfide bond formation protein DsbC [Chromatium okenii]|uniref:DsbC family protein n=1 Tax=Chromatium okenii TaxID=61644 RepID=UPI001904340A|nr:DsbC family protein [Chromatium okenii]MBK1642211.1 disulfide bond formation protein DsbC [Chromatium okenii]